MLTLLNDHASTDKLYGKIKKIQILDSGWRKRIYKHLQPTSPYTIGMPNEAETVGVEKGSVCLGLNFIFHNVLHIPNLKFNLISLGQLMDDTCRIITLVDDLLVI